MKPDPSYDDSRFEGSVEALEAEQAEAKIRRPPVEYNDGKHEYRLDGVKLDGVSTVAKVGEDDVWGVAAAWAFRIGYEGAYELLVPHPEAAISAYNSADDLRGGLKQARKTPWHKTDDSKERGNAIHAALESLAQKNEVPKLEDFPEAYRGYVRALCAWYLDFRPSFVATEVQVVSETHKFAGRYDLRVKIPGYALEQNDPNHNAYSGEWLCLVDLKTGKRVYPTSQFVQLAGYELAGVEMGYPATDAQFVLNVHEDGSYEFERSVATGEHFLAYLAAHRAIKDIKSKVPKKKKEKK